MPKVKFKGWVQGLRKVSLTKLLQERADLSLTSAKYSVDRILDGETITIEMQTIEEANQLSKEASMLGAVCEIISDDSTSDSKML